MKTASADSPPPAADLRATDAGRDPNTPTTKRGMIRGLSDDALIDRVDSLSRTERCDTLDVLRHLIEVDRRRLWRTLEYQSMFDYCVRRLRYSEGAASRRIRTARLIARCPRVYHRIRDGRLSVCAVAKIARAVLDDGRTDLIDQIEGKRLDQIDAIIATHKDPSRPVRESIRLLCVERRVDAGREKPPQLGSGGADAPAGAKPTKNTTAPATANSGPADGPNAGDSPANAVPVGGPATRSQDDGGRHTVVERVFRFQFGVDAATMAKFSRVQSIAARRAGRHVDLSDLFGVLCDTYLERHDPVQRAQRSEKRRRKTAAPPRPGKGQERPARARHLPQPVRDAVIRRDGGRCTFVDSTGRRCTETIDLEIDHVKPFALGGEHEMANLRVMCAAHNRLMAERTFGRVAMTPRQHRRE